MMELIELPFVVGSQCGLWAGAPANAPQRERQAKGATQFKDFHFFFSPFHELLNEIERKERRIDGNGAEPNQKRKQLVVEVVDWRQSGMSFGE